MSSSFPSTNSPNSQPRSGYTLPVFACAAAIAALRHLHQSQPTPSVELNLVEPAASVTIPVEQVACLNASKALAITRSDPGDNLDLTRNTPVWAVVELNDPNQQETIVIQGGEGIGRQQDADNQPAIYAYAHRLFHANLQPLLHANETICITIILPEGRRLGDRTSNAAFGVVEGLALLGTSGIAQPLSAPGQLAAFQAELQQKASRYDCLVFCVGENGLDLAQNLGIERDRLIKTANWLGSMLVEAGMQKIPSILLFGYHGKLIKLAGGIFHTHHHVADGRQEILAAHCASQGLPTADVQAILTSATAEAALKYLNQLDAAGSCWVDRVYGAIAYQIDRRAQTYIQTHSDQTVTVGSVLFNRDRQIFICSQTGHQLISQICYFG